MKKTTPVLAYMLLLSLSNKLILFGSHYWSPCKNSIIDCACGDFLKILFQESETGEKPGKCWEDILKREESNNTEELIDQNKFTEDYFIEENTTEDKATERDNIDDNINEDTLYTEVCSTMVEQQADVKKKDSPLYFSLQKTFR